MKDIMLDLEAMDTMPTAAIVAIGAVQCDLTTGELGDTFYRVVDLAYQEAMGFSVSASTVYWWMEQSEQARAAICEENKIGIGPMCNEFEAWLLSIDDSGQKLRLWGNGASYDNAVIRYAFHQCGNDMPIEFWNDRDMRTILGFYPKNLQAIYRKNNLRKGGHHNAMEDAKYQIEFCTHILQELGVKELY